jgi:hypothetical protein
VVQTESSSSCVPSLFTVSLAIEKSLSIAVGRLPAWVRA